MYSAQNINILEVHSKNEGVILHPPRQIWVIHPSAPKHPLGGYGYLSTLIACTNMF